MSFNQKFFDSIYEDQFFGPQDGFLPRAWQIECLGFYATSSASDAPGDGPSCFTLYGGVASGKTNAAGMIGSYRLNSKEVDQIVVVVPNRSILRKTRAVFQKNFRIDLVPFAGRSAQKIAHNGVGRLKQGYILTYSKLMQDPNAHRGLCSRIPTMVIFDEIHHLGDGTGWGDAAKEAFGKARFILALTGTPYRSDDTRIPFVVYEQTDKDGIFRFSADPEKGTGYTYSLGRAVAEGVCRKPLFQFHDGTVRCKEHPDAVEVEVTFEQQVTESLSALRLRGAVKYGSEARDQFLAETLDRCRSEHRKVIIFLGGDTDGDQPPTEDATSLLPSDLERLGIRPGEYVHVTGDDADAQSKIENFGASDAWILISINMVSEGTDIPQLSAAIFLTSITAMQTTVQRIGRAMRIMGEDDPHPDALIFMFDDPNLRQLSLQIQGEIDSWTEILLKRRKRTTSDLDPTTRHRRAESIGIAGGNACKVVFNGKEYPIEAIRRAERRALDFIAAEGLPRTLLQSVLALMMEDYDVDSDAA